MITPNGIQCKENSLITKGLLEDYWMDQKDYWDKAAETKEFTLPFSFELFSHWAGSGRSGRIPSEQVRAQSQSDLDIPVLDIGCGYGRTLQELYEIGYCRLTGIDFSSRMIARGRDLFPHLDLRTASGGSLPFSDASFGAVIIFAVVTGNYRDADQDLLMAETFRVLKPGGIVYLCDFLLNHDQRNLERYARFADTYGTYGVFELPDGGIVRHHTRKRAEALVQAFTVLHFEETVFTTMNGNRSNGFTCIARKPGV
jgi:SAM-dependent methyltransferase